VSRGSDVLQGINSESEPPWEGTGPVPDPCIYGPGLQVWLGPGPPRVRTEPLEWDSDPPYGVWAAHSGVPGFQDRTYLGLNQDPGGGLEPTCVQTWSGGIRTYLHTLLLCNTYFVKKSKRRNEIHVYMYECYLYLSFHVDTSLI
jgi:hypothetical protein